jgi:muramoyltetrapeptide carboxypeptidase
MDVIKPRRLSRGQTVGVIAPASPPRSDGAVIPQWLEQIRALGFHIKQGEHLYDRRGYMAGQDVDRAADINRMFGDDEVDGIICLRSGYGSARTLPYLDFDLIRNNPKIIIGFSDLTALINSIHARTGLVTFHGPEAEDQLVQTTYALAEFDKVVVQGESGIPLGAPPASELHLDGGSSGDSLVRYVAGKARGRLLGGNLPTLVGLLGTPYEPDFTGKLLFLESIGEDTYAQGRYLHQLWLAGKLRQVVGVAFGQFEEVEERVFTLHEVLSEWFIKLNIPELYGLEIGHMDEQATVPLGCEAELDVDAGTLTLLEAAVV